MADGLKLPSVDLAYRIASCTDYSGKYIPEHILVNSPTDQTSRWSGANQTASHKQWIILELNQPSIVLSIMFGKFHKAHPCNMKEFKVYTGRSLDSLRLALHAGLNNDHIPETFNLDRPNEAGLRSPIRFIKIVPLFAHSPSFHTSIWHVALKGINDPDYVRDAEVVYASHKETSALRHVLKYLRQRRHLSSFQALQQRTGLELEHPVVTKIYDSLMSGDWLILESLLKTAAEEALYDGYIDASDPKALWTRLNGANVDGDVPSPRGGHQLCIDTEVGLIYLFGGWDGEKDLDDLWVYSISEDRWKMLSASTALDGGPGPRSCHKMVFDPLFKYIYLIGRLADGEAPGSSSPSTTVTPEQTQDGPTAPTTSAPVSVPRVVTTTVPEPVSKPLPSDFYRYTTRGPNAGQWTVLSQDTALEDGPPLLHDHQMEIDPDKQILYVFGGRFVNGEPDSAPLKCSGLYRYHIATGKWELVMDETGTCKISRTIPTRYGHSMVFDPRSNRIFILAGKKIDYLADMYIYDTRSQEVTEIASDFSTSGGPDPCFCQRAAMDPESGHIYLLPGLLKPKGQKNSNSDGTLRSTFWIYRHEKMTWTQVANARAQAADVGWDMMEDTLQPQPRYAHQMVYDSSRKEFFVHGGNSGQDGNRRLDDFWSMKFERPSREEIIRRATFIARRQHFKELCDTVPPVQALTFLQREVYTVVDHLSADETATFRALHSHLFESTSHSSRPESGDVVERDVEMFKASDVAVTFETRKDMPPIPELNVDVTERGVNPELTPDRFRQRTQVFESFLEFVNVEAKQPATDLVDLVETTHSENF